MTFTYDNTSVASNLARCRSQIRDVTASAGPLPAGSNFTDEEITEYIAQGGTWQRAVVLLYDSLAAAWSTEFNFRADGLQADRGQVAAAFEKMAAKWAKQYGRPGGMVVAAMKRVDAYSDDVEADDVEPGGEFTSDRDYLFKILR